VFDANSHKPTGLLSLAVDYFTQEKIIVVINPHQRSVTQRLVEPDLGPTFAEVSHLTVKNPARSSKNAHDGGLTELVALSLSLIRLLIERARRIHDHSLRAHDDMFLIPSSDCYRSGVLIALRPSP